LWSGSYEGELRDVVVLQEQVAAAIASEIGLTLNARGHGRMPRSRPVDLAAYDAYLKGRHQVLNAYTEESSQKAAVYFQQALALDPNYHAEAHVWYGMHLGGIGRFDEAQSELEPARKLDPASLAMRVYAAVPLYYAHRYDEIIQRLQSIVDINQDYHPSYAFLGLAYEQKRDWTKAVAELERAYQLDPQPEALAQLGHVYAVAGRGADARRVLAQLTQLARERYVSAYNFAVLYAGLGDSDEAFRWLQKVEQDRSEWFGAVNVDPRLDGLHADPRFAVVLRSVGLAK
jgi:tetratricopeptide (TPR) repeat protein